MTPATRRLHHELIEGHHTSATTTDAPEHWPIPTVKPNLPRRPPTPATTVSTTLIPPSYYVVEPRGHAARVYNTLTDVAAAIYLLAPTPATISALTGTRRRSLTDAELHDLGQDVRSLRLHTRNPSSVTAAARASRCGACRRRAGCWWASARSARPTSPKCASALFFPRKYPALSRN